MQKLVFFLVKERSTYYSKSGAAGVNGGSLAARQKKPAKGTVRGTKRPASQISTTSPTPMVETPSGPQMSPLPAGSSAYPTVLDNARLVSETKVTDDPLSQAEMQQIIDILVREGRVEPIRLGGGRTGYRVTAPAGGGGLPARRCRAGPPHSGAAQLVHADILPDARAVWSRHGPRGEAVCLGQLIRSGVLRRHDR